MNPPRVFISYSHDSAEHKGWVLDFATTLRNRGIDAVLDQWDLKPGDDLPHFMETQLDSANYILMICTEKYVEKANTGIGGVGYEKMILTSSLLKKIDSNKIIPIILQQGTNKRPSFLKTKIYIDFSNGDENEYNFDNLLRTLLNSPLYEKPKIGENSFKSMGYSRPNRISNGVKEIMIIVAKCYENRAENYIEFVSIVRETSIHRLTIEKYINVAINQKLLISEGYEEFSITSIGINYLEINNII